MAITVLRVRRPATKRSRKVIYVAAGLCMAGAVPLGTAVYSSASRGLNPFTAWACTTEKRGGLNDVSGWDLDIEHTSCDLFSKQEAITVYASPHEAVASQAGWFRNRTLLFRYLPGAPDDLLPSFEATGPNRILITVPSIGSVAVQKHSLGKTAVNYHIGHIEYPDPGRLSQAH
jgi:hypothetical protein